MENTNTEARKQRFKVVASRRVQKVLDDMENLSKCANKRNYEYTDEEIKKMFKVLNEKYMQLKAAFAATSGQEKETFKF
ncbi:hypothetical protein [Larkinella soli]|uniref:hypothetical protein n=1 Tax=Larkinella soli TaxID=1770527 RepID=UPI000FFB8E32|nr:hypothetical protein [Larkinella soli]